jgi:trehalose 6-phosphate phosphatase
MALGMAIGYGLLEMRNAAPAPSREWCLFLDVDGTLVEIAETPSAVVVDPSLTTLITAVAQRLNGAVALVSGRSIATLDELFAPFKLPAAGQHGAERRAASGRLYGANTGRDPGLNGARAPLRAFVDSHPGTLFEDKGRTIAVHFRLAPHFEGSVRCAVAAAAAGLEAGYEVQAGDRVFEIKPKGFTKASAAEAFMTEAPFAGRTPVFVGDDLTDEPGLRFAEQAGGISIAVGDRIGGQWRFENPREVRRWLASIAAMDEAPRGRTRVAPPPSQSRS